MKAWIQRSALLLLITAAVALMLLGRTQSGVVEGARSAVADAVAPMLDFASRPISGTVDALEGAQNLMALAQENAELREANRRLQSWQAVAYRLEAENGALRELLRMAPDPRSRYVTARVVADNGGTFVRSVLVNAGARDGVVRGQAAGFVPCENNKGGHGTEQARHAEPRPPAEYRPVRLGNPLFRYHPGARQSGRDF